MNLTQAFNVIYAGGPGSGCKGPNCGRPATGQNNVPTSHGRLELTMERSGTFKPKLKATPGHVGKCDMPSKNVYRYHAQVTATDEHLSKEGFIMDNARIQDFFDNAYNGLSEMSCEKMASFAARGLGAILEHEHISCTGVQIQIGGSNGAWLTAVWKPINAGADGFDFQDDDEAKKSFTRIHRALGKAGFKDQGAGLYVHPDGTKITISYRPNRKKADETQETDLTETKASV